MNSTLASPKCPGEAELGKSWINVQPWCHGYQGFTSMEKRLETRALQSTSRWGNLYASGGQWGGIFVNSVGSRWNNGKMHRCWLVWTLVRWCYSFNSSCFLFCSRHCKFDKKGLWRCYFWALDEVGGYVFIFSWNPVPKNAWIVHTQQHRPKVPKMWLRWKHIQKPFGCLISHQGHPAKSTCLKVSQPSLRAVWHNLQRWLLDPIREPKVLASHLDTTLHGLHNFLSYG